MLMSLPRGPLWALPLALSLFAGKAAAQTYSLVDNYSPDNWFDQFTFFTDGDPTNGHVQYVNQTWASQNGLIRSNGSVYMGVDHMNVYSETGPGRPSVRVESKKVYNRGLFILDLNHMPVGCGTWPAWWTLGKSAEWPAGGEIDIIEGVNNNLNNTNKIYTSTGCSITGLGQTAVADSFNCADGCGSASTRTDSYGNGFNKADGGVYAMEWTSQWIRVWFFSRSSVPGSIGKGSPDISEFGTPTANFQGGCDIDQHFKDHTIIFDITFCGDWAGPTFGRYAGCPMTDSNAWTSCNNFVASSPQSFADAYWDINSMKVFQRGSGAAPGDHSSVSISDAVRLSSSMGVPLGKSQAAPSSVKSSLAINFAEGAAQKQSLATPTSPGAFFASVAAISTPQRQRPGPSSLSSRPSPNNGGGGGGRGSGPSNAAFRTASSQPSCSPLGGYSGSGQMGYRHGIGASDGGLAMCQENCAESAQCTAVLYAHYKSDSGSPLGYWDCWWGTLDVGSVLCGSGGSTSGGSSRNGKAQHRRAHLKRQTLAKRQGIDMSPNPNIGVREQDFQVFMSRGGGGVADVSSSSAGLPMSGSSSPAFVFPDSSSLPNSPSSTPSRFPFVPDFMPDGAQSSVVTPTNIATDDATTATPSMPPFDRPFSPTTSSNSRLRAGPRPALTDHSDAFFSSYFSSLSFSLSESISSSLSSQLYSSSQAGDYSSTSSTIPQSAHSLARAVVTNLLVPVPLTPNSISNGFTPSTSPPSNPTFSSSSDQPSLAFPQPSLSEIHIPESRLFRPSPSSSSRSPPSSLRNPVSPSPSNNNNGPPFRSTATGRPSRSGPNPFAAPSSGGRGPPSQPAAQPIRSRSDSAGTSATDAAVPGPFGPFNNGPGAAPPQSQSPPARSSRDRSRSSTDATPAPGGPPFAAAASASSGSRGRPPSRQPAAQPDRSGSGGGGGPFPSGPFARPSGGPGPFVAPSASPSSGSGGGGGSGRGSAAAPPFAPSGRGGGSTTTAAGPPGGANNQPARTVTVTVTMTRHVGSDGRVRDE
ncbi:endo-beta-glucanase [Diplodia corticola]|uniref:Endo-beta-glucanase n=1 Tax=Diplodia corticola TaxID=236234 RepID=A0A1J9RPI5_9PEZI|nr:endo-beta-glucanase [Diplodia corticola]OJD29828.1 endo-beta-glucanase [Diplodia corticola]